MIPCRTKVLYLLIFYYYLLFEDIDGIRLEINYVPKKGVFEKNVKFNPAGDY